LHTVSTVAIVQIVTPESYTLTARCHDLPELVDQTEDGISLALPSGAIDRVVEAVAGRRGPCAILQEKIDGCWCALKLDAAARVESVTSRSGLHLRVAVAWMGEQFDRQLAGFTLIGEVEAGTHWSSVERHAEESEGGDVRVPRLHLYAALDRAGRVLSVDRTRKLCRWIAHPRCLPVRECRPNESWETFTRSVLEAGGEGVVIRTADGEIFRAKPRTTVDRYVSRTYAKPDRHGTMRLFCDLSFFNGRSFTKAQTVLVPEAMTPQQLRRAVVVVVGASLDPVTGVVRHARIADVRPQGEKTARECVI
jgi:hypothetical protein